MSWPTTSIPASNKMAKDYSPLPQHTSNSFPQDIKLEIDAEQQQQQQPAGVAPAKSSRRKLVKAIAIASASFLILRAGVTSVVDILDHKMDLSLPKGDRHGSGYLDGELVLLSLTIALCVAFANARRSSPTLPLPCADAAFVADGFALEPAYVLDPPMMHPHPAIALASEQVGLETVEGRHKKKHHDHGHHHHGHDKHPRPQRPLPPKVAEGIFLSVPEEKSCME